MKKLLVFMVFLIILTSCSKNEINLNESTEGVIPLNPNCATTYCGGANFKVSLEAQEQCALEKNAVVTNNLSLCFKMDKGINLLGCPGNNPPWIYASRDRCIFILANSSNNFHACEDISLNFTELFSTVFGGENPWSKENCVKEIASNLKKRGNEVNCTTLTTDIGRNTCFSVINKGNCTLLSPGPKKTECLLNYNPQELTIELCNYLKDIWPKEIEYIDCVASVAINSRNSSKCDVLKPKVVSGGAFWKIDKCYEKFFYNLSIQEENISYCEKIPSFDGATWAYVESCVNSFAIARGIKNSDPVYCNLSRPSFIASCVKEVCAYYTYMTCRTSGELPNFYEDIFYNDGEAFGCEENYIYNLKECPTGWVWEKLEEEFGGLK